MFLQQSNIPTSKNPKSGFTLIELMIAMSIFAVMSVMILSVYFSTTQTSRKLNATRQLSEVAREITERLAQDVREKGILDAGYGSGFDNSYPLWKNYDYTASGSEFLKIQGLGVYVYGAKTTTGMKPCVDDFGMGGEKTKTDPKIHCGFYLVISPDNGKDAYNLVDSFIPEEEKKRVKIEDLKFYVSGDDSTSKKVTINFTLALMPRIGVPSATVSSTKLHIQTTISERIFKTY